MTIDPQELARKKRRHRNERIAAAILVLIAAAVTANMLRLRRREDAELRRDTRYVPKKDVVTPEIELLREYVRIDTSNPPGVEQGAKWLVAQLASRGIPAQLIESAPGFFNVYARIKGRNAGGALVLLNHIDVVPVGQGWSHPPFEGAIVFNEFYGRGALDMKSIALCELLAFANVAASGRAPEHDLIFLATADEERGSANGLRWLLENRPDIFEGVELAINEGGLAEMMSEQMTYFGIEIGGKQAVTARLEADSREALLRARFRLQRYVTRRDADRIVPGVRQYFQDVAPTRVSSGRYLADIDATVARGELWRLPFTYREFVQNTLRFGALTEVAGRASMTVFLLNLPDADPDERIEWLRREVAPEGVRIAEITSKQGPIPTSRSDTALFRILAGQAQRQYHVRAGIQILYQSLTDCRFLRMRNVACYGLSPFPVNVFQASAIHGRDERIRVDWFHEGIVYVDAVVKAWASQAQ